MYNTAFFKVIVMIVITILLNALCQGGMTIVSWIIVFVPFMFMSVIVGILLYVFGLDAATGTLNFKCDDESTKNKTTNLIYTIEDNINGTTSASASDSSSSSTSTANAPSGTSDPQYE
jgi:hypothetical protein